MNFRLTIYPCVDTARKAYTKQFFESKKDMFVAKYVCADLLTFLQDQLKAMDDESNIFICHEFVDGEWEEIEVDHD